MTPNLHKAVAAAALVTAAYPNVPVAEPVNPELFEDDAPPKVLSNEPTSPHFRPDLLRVGVKVDGVERNDISFYNVATRTYRTIHGGSGEGEIEPFWRYPATRQQRRALARWQEKQKRK